MGERRTNEPNAPNKRRVSVGEAARVLGITDGAVRMRINRGTLDSDKDNAGRVYVYITPPHTGDHTGDTRAPTPDRTDQLIRQLEDRVKSLEEANSENRRIIAALTSRIPQLESPVREASPAPSDAPTGDTGGAEKATESTRRRSWWRRVIRG